jgi:hypothetical protein
MEAEVVGNFRYVFGPLAGILALLVLLIFCRLIFGTGRKSQAAPDFGLLVTIASMPTRAAAEIARDLLARQGIRATLSDRPSAADPVQITADGRELPKLPPGTLTYVLVFPTDEPAARQLLG